LQAIEGASGADSDDAMLVETEGAARESAKGPLQPRPSVGASWIGARCSIR